MKSFDEDIGRSTWRVPRRLESAPTVRAGGAGSHPGAAGLSQGPQSGRYRACTGGGIRGMIAPMTPPTATPPPLTEDDIQRLQALLDGVPAPLEPLDVSALDGYLCGVLLQPQPVLPAQWWPGVVDVDARPLPAGFDAAELQALVQRRHAELAQAIARRDWFDPWVFQLDEEAMPSEAVLPWVAGLAAAQDRFPGLMASDDPALVEPLALLYLHFERDDLEDADALLAVIDTLEPPDDLAEAVQDLVRSVMLIADVTQPRRRTPPGHARPGPGPRSRSGRRARR